MVIIREEFTGAYWKGVVTGEGNLLEKEFLVEKGSSWREAFIGANWRGTVSGVGCLLEKEFLLYKRSYWRRIFSRKCFFFQVHQIF